ncbi:anaerobic glycerol-3-phosphate dehydrogenase subunit B [Labilibaculum manganireducens]|uniref:Anaerobic glycerol-3-phosphate dehydrogenase subunit B n=1 Tax=Labilibaculum manganireducens TaxID=1940525 RepID=A0A2N3IAG7_9BACT|nr:glycerol-3-phosphate dehydrogenase subunit GlpB [Labilibaculum manganireducens]PKQ67297.1 anaerobic glycerol-3-phosphate dehydrogenase subunit B [Labilibaculum manganireducens]
MKFDNIIIGGGLSGLTCGIKLAEQGKKCAIVSSGQSAIHFFSGSFDLLGKMDGQDVKNPLEAIKILPDTHPYQRVGIENISRLVVEAPRLLDRAGLNFFGKADENHFVLTPMGIMKPTWLTIDDFTRFEQNDAFPWKKAVILNFSGFLDFHTLFVQDGLKKYGVDTQIKNFAMKEFEAIRRNPSEMRSTNIAKVFDSGDALDEFAQKVNQLSEGFEVVLLPAVFGLFTKNVALNLKAKVNKPVVLLPAIPPSVPGIRSQILLRKRFEELGGTYFLGDNVEEGTFKNNRLVAVQTNNHGDIKLEADQFVLASGSFYSKGIVATREKLYEPILGLDIDGDTDSEKWLDEKFFNDQPYMHYGVKTDSGFRALKNGKPIENLFVAGSVLGGANALKEGSGAGISLLTSLHVAEQILK